MKKLLLTLGTIATVVAPIATVVSCGNSNELGKEKETAEGDLNFYHFSQIKHDEFMSQIKHAKNTDEVSKIMEAIDKAGRALQNVEKTLDTPKSNAIGEVGGLTNIDQTAKDGYIDQINAATTQDEINTALRAAEDADKKIEDLSAVTVAINGRVAEYAPKENLYLKKDYTKWIAEIKKATSYDELTSACNSLDATINHPSIFAAKQGDYKIQLDNGKFLYFAKDDTETSVVDMSDAKQSVTTFKKTGTDSSGIPTLEVWKDGVKTTKSYVIEQVKSDDYGLVLKDMTGAYHIDGVKDEADFIINADIIAFIERSIPVLDSKTENPEDIDGMLTVVDALQNPTDTYKHVTLSADNSKIELATI